ncbi:MAG: hypothetical protein ACYSUC_10685 [Planctomycetota bacterium]
MKMEARPAVSMIMNTFSKTTARTAVTAAATTAGVTFRPVRKYAQIPPAAAPRMAASSFLTRRPPSQINSPTMTQATPRPIWASGLSPAIIRSKYWVISSIYLLSARGVVRLQ